MNKNSKQNKLQNKFRGLVSEVKSHRFIMGGSSTSRIGFWVGFKELLLKARLELRPAQYEPFLTWINHQLESQLPDLGSHPKGFDTLSGISNRSETQKLELELGWVVSRIVVNKEEVGAFRKQANNLERSTFSGNFGDSISTIEDISAMFGESIWAVQLRIGIETISLGLEQQKRYAAKVRKIYRQGLLGFITYHTSVRNEEKTTLDRYRNEIASRIERHRYYSDDVKIYVKYKLTGILPEDKRSLAAILHVEQNHSLIDLYETTLDILQKLTIGNYDQKTVEYVKSILTKLVLVDDFRLIKLMVANGVKDSPVQNLVSRNDNISSNIFSGDNANAMKSARRELMKDGSMDLWQLIYSSIACGNYLSRNFSNQGRFPIKSIVIRDAFEGSLSLDDALTKLAKITQNLSALPLAKGLHFLIASFTPDNISLKLSSWQFGLYSPSFGIEDLNPSNNFVFFDNAYFRIADNPTYQAWRIYAGAISVNSNQVTDSTRKTFEFAKCVREEDFLSASYDIPNLDVDSSSLYFINTLLLLRYYFFIGDAEKLVHLLVNTYTSLDFASRVIPIESTLSGLEWSDYKKIEDSIAAPIALHMLWSVNQSSETLTMLRFSVRIFLLKSDMSKPSNIISYMDSYSLANVVYFLRNVCVPEVLDVSKALTSSKEVLEERQLICALLIELDKDNEEDYQEESVLISNKMVLEEGRRIVDQTRIHVDDAALIKWAQMVLSEDYERYRDLLDVDLDIEQDFDTVLSEILSEPHSKHIKFDPKNEADAVLVSIISIIHFEFLFNPKFGFDFHLSKRIRHQSFIGAIRGPLEFSRLITTRVSMSGSYNRNDYWHENFSSLTIEEHQTFDKILESFSVRFDELLTDVKDNRLHINSDDKPSGLISLSLTPQYLALARSIVRRDSTSLDFFQTIVAILWAAVNPSLVRVREYIESSLKQSVVDLLDELRASVKVIAEHDPVYLQFDMEVGNASKEVQTALDDVSSWFSRPNLEEQQKTFSIDHILKISLDSAKKCQRGFSPKIESHVSNNEDLLLMTSSLVFVHDVIFVALDNVKAHSNVQEPQVYVRVTPDIINGTLSISIRSECKVQDVNSKRESLKAIRALIEEGNSFNRTRREGRSGFFKLAAVIGQSEKGYIHFDITDDGWFELDVVYSLIIQPNQDFGAQSDRTAIFAS